jgi:hypothetical protein
MGKKVSPWIIVDGYCATRIIEGGNVDNIADRIAFIEKTPRVRIREYSLGCDSWNGGERCWAEHLDWCSNRDLSSNAFDEDARKWCDGMLVALGYELT